MKKNTTKIFIAAIFLTISGTAYAQEGRVGINTSTPAATLDVVASPSNATRIDGFIAPRLKGSELKAKEALYTTAQEGAIVYVTEAVSGVTDKTTNVTSIGYYYFDKTQGTAGRWMKIANPSAAGIYQEPWNNVADGTPATTNTQNLYQTGDIGIRTNSPKATLDVQANDTGRPFGIIAPRVTAVQLRNAGGNFNADQDAALVYVTQEFGSSDTPTDRTSNVTSIGYYYFDKTQGANGRWMKIANPTTITYQEPWVVQGSTTPATTNSQDISQNASVAVGKSTAYNNTNQTMLDVAGAARIGTNQTGVVGVNSFAIGDGNTSSGNGSFAAGQNNKATGPQSFAIGNASNASGNGSFAGGYWNNSNGGATASAQSSFAFGEGSSASQPFAVAIGNNNKSTGTGSVAIGNNNNASGEYSFASGYKTNTTNLYDFAVGNQTSASGGASFAAGYNSQALGNNSIALGNGVIARGTNSTAFGLGTTASGNQSVAFGFGSKSSNVSSFAAGNSTSASGSGSAAFGDNSSASGDNSLATGAYSQAIGNNSFTTGAFSQAIGNNSFAGGSSDSGGASKANGDRSFAWGYKANAAGNLSLAFGNEVVSNGDMSTTFGWRNSANNQGELALGLYSVNDIANDGTIFKVGTGTDAASRYNGITVYQKGGDRNGSYNYFVAIGSSANTQPTRFGTEALRVYGSIRSATANYADYVFEDYYHGTSVLNPNYKFTSLYDTEKYIKANHHLPGVTSVKELEKTKDGYSFNLTDLSTQSLEKIEELYLHTIEQQKQIDSQKTELDVLKDLIQKQQKQIDALLSK